MDYSKQIEKLKQQYIALGKKTEERLEKAIKKGALAAYKKGTYEYVEAELELDEKLNAKDNKKRSETLRKYQALLDKQAKESLLDIKKTIQKDTVKMLKTRLKHQEGEEKVRQTRIYKRIPKKNGSQRETN